MSRLCVYSQNERSMLELARYQKKVEVACSSDGRCNLFSNTETVLGKMKQETPRKLA